MLYNRPHRVTGLELRILLNAGDSNPFSDRHIAVVGIFAARQNPKKCGLTRAIRANETDTIALGEGKTDVLKERIGSKGFGDSLSIYNRRQRLAISPLAVLSLSGNAGKGGSASPLTVSKRFRTHHGRKVNFQAGIGV